jgi:hypothetical protein
MRIVILVALGFVWTDAAVAWSWSCPHKAPREATVEAGGATALRVLAKAGALRVAGEPGLSQVVVRGNACASKAALLGSIRLRAQRIGDVVHVEAELPEGSWDNEQAVLDLDIRVPAGLAAEIEDGSGEAEISGLASVRIDDGSGSLRITDVAGEVRVRDGSGELEVAHAGSVVVEEDGSGSIVVRDVKSSVTVDNDGSGSIEVRDVAGDLTITDSGSGGVQVENVQGRVDVPRRDRKHRRR